MTSNLINLKADQADPTDPFPLLFPQAVLADYEGIMVRRANKQWMRVFEVAA